MIVMPKAAMILAAGFGTRMRPLSDHVPKPLLPFMGTPMLAYLINWLARSGVERIVINLHHLGSQISSALGDGRRFGVSLHYSQEPDLLGTGGGLQAARRWLDSGTFWLLNSDAVFLLNPAEVLRRHQQSGADATLVVREVADAETYGALYLDSADLVCGLLGHNPQQGRPVMFAGIHLLEPSIFDFLPQKTPSCIVRDCYMPRFSSLKLAGYRMPSADWHDLGTLERYYHGHLALLERPEFLPDDAAYDPQNHSVVQSRDLLESCHIAHSYVGSAVTVPRGCSIEHCVILPGSSLESLSLRNMLVYPGGSINMPG